MRGSLSFLWARLVRYLHFFGDTKPADDELIDLDTTKPRATDHETTDRESADRQCTDRQRTDHGRAYGRYVPLLGGVGYYPDSDFVHIDTGRVRRW